MRGVFIFFAGLLLGVLATWGYGHYLGDGVHLTQTQTQLTKVTSLLTQTTQDSHELKDETEALSGQVQRLTSANDELKRQVEDLKKDVPAVLGAATPTAAPVNPMAGMMKVGLERQREEKLLLLKTRLHLTPDQEAAVKVALEAQGKQAEEMVASGKFDPQAFKNAQGVKSLDQTLRDILTPDQKTTYQQIQTEEENNSTDMAVTVEINQMSPLLQLSDTQKDQVYSKLYQVQQNMKDPAWIKNNLSSGTNPIDPMILLQHEAKAKEDALAGILTSDQLAAYHQQIQSQLELQESMMQKFMPPKP